MTEAKDWGNHPVGMWVVARSTEQGCMFGRCEYVDGRTCVLSEARQLYEWQSKFVLTELASFGPKGSNNRFGHPSAEPVRMSEFCGLLPVGPGVKDLFDAVEPQDF